MGVVGIDIRKSSVLKFLESAEKDVFAKAEGYCRYADALKEERIYGYRIHVLEREGDRALVEVQGERKWVIDCASNDYLSMNANPRVREATRAAVAQYGVGAQGASMLNGNATPHLELEAELGAYLGKEAVLLSSSGYAAQIGATQGLLRPSDAAFFDRFSHTSLTDGMRLSGATTYKYPHLDLDALGKLLEDYRGRHHGALIVTDGVFSAEGTVADVAGLVDLALRYEARVLVDDAHGLGTLNGGRGSGFPVSPDIITGTLSKTLAGAGGFVAGPAEVIQYLRLFGSANCSTTNLSIANAAASLEALRIMRDDPSVVARLNENVQHMRRALATRGLETVDSVAPIFGLVCGDDIQTFRSWRRMFDLGVLCHALPFPIVPFGKSRLRVRVNASLTRESIDEVVNALSDVGKSLVRRATGRPAQVRSMSERGLVRRDVSTDAGPLAVHESGAGPTVLFLHSLLFGSEIYGDVLATLAGEAHLVAIDLWGHGASAPPTRPMSLDEMAERLWSVVEALGLQTLPIALVGTSLGSMIALRMAAQRPDSVSHLLLVGSSADPEDGPARKLFESLTAVASSIGGEAIVEDILLSQFSSFYVNNHPLCQKVWPEYILRRSVRDYAACVKAVLERPSALSLLGAIRAQTVVMVGDEDVAEPMPHSTALCEGIAGSELRVVSPSGHLIPVERPLEIVRVLRGWLRQEAEDRQAAGEESVAAMC